MNPRPSPRLQLRAAGTVAVGLLAGAGILATEQVRTSSRCISLSCAPLILSVAVVTGAICVIVAIVALYPSAVHNRAGLRRRGSLPLVYATAAGAGWIMFAGVGLYLLLGVASGAHPVLPMWLYATVVAVCTIFVGAWAHRSVSRGGWELVVFGVLTGLAAGVVALSVGVAVMLLLL